MGAVEKYNVFPFITLYYIRYSGVKGSKEIETIKHADIQASVLFKTMPPTET